MKVSHFHSSTINTDKVSAARVSKQFADKKIAWIFKICVIISIPLFAWYILLTNSISTKGFLLAQEKEEQSELQQQLEKLEINLTIPTSLYALESSEQVQEMEYLKKQTFVEIKSSDVAFAQ